jgi:hypothetical protein
VLIERRLVRVRMLEDVLSTLGGWKATAAETVGFAASAIEAMKSAASRSNEDYDHMMSFTTVLFVKQVWQNDSW